MIQGGIGWVGEDLINDLPESCLTNGCKSIFQRQ